MPATLPERKTVSYRVTPVPQSVQLLAFRRQGRDFAVPMSAVRELTTADDLVPSESGTRLKGVCSIGGTNIPVVELVPNTSIAIWESAAQLIVISSRSQWIGLVYDQIVEVCSIRSNQIKFASTIDDEWPRVELDHGRTAYLDPAKMIRSPELALLDSMAAVVAYELVG